MDERAAIQQMVIFRVTPLKFQTTKNEYSKRSIFWRLKHNCFSSFILR